MVAQGALEPLVVNQEGLHRVCRHLPGWVRTYSVERLRFDMRLNHTLISSSSRCAWCSWCRTSTWRAIRQCNTDQST